MALTSLKRKFVEGTLQGLNKTKAAIYAGYSEASAAQAGSRLSRDMDVINELPKARLAGNLGKSKPYHAAKEKVVKVAKKSVIAAQDEVKEPPQKTIKVTVEEVEQTHLTSDPLEFMARVMNDMTLDDRIRLDAAKALASFKCPKPGELGKKEAKEQAAKIVSKKFQQAMPPKLVVNNR
jgi:phage terminase small subunit